MPCAIKFSQDRATESQPNDFVTPLQQSQQKLSYSTADWALHAILREKEKLKLIKDLAGAGYFFHVSYLTMILRENPCPVFQRKTGYLWVGSKFFLHLGMCWTLWHFVWKSHGRQASEKEGSEYDFGKWENEFFPTVVPPLGEADFHCVRGRQPSIIKYSWAIVHQKGAFPYCGSQPAEFQTYKILMHSLS